MAWLLDTNVLSEVRKPRPEPRVTAFVNAQPLSECYISVVSIVEIRFGIESQKDSARRIELENWLAKELHPAFKDRILPITEEILLLWRLLLEDGRKSGYNYSHPDLMLAATAQHHGLTVVTRDRRHFDKAGVSVFNPWE